MARRAERGSASGPSKPKVASLELLPFPIQACKENDNEYNTMVDMSHRDHLDGLSLLLRQVALGSSNGSPRVPSVTGCFISGVIRPIALAASLAVSLGASSSGMTYTFPAHHDAVESQFSLPHYC